MQCVVLCLLSAAVLAGCAARPMVSSEEDIARALAIERAARSSGVQVIWVHYPARTTLPAIN